MAILAIVPGLWAAWLAWTRSPQRAFLDAYLPALLLLPDYYRWIAPGLPDPTFGQAAIIPVASVCALRAGFGRWRPSVMDALAIGFTATVCYSEYLASGYKDAQNLMVQMLAGFLLPYAVAKALIEPKGLRTAFARRVVFLIFVSAILSIWEFRMGFTPQQRLLGVFFPGQGSGWVTVYRWGFWRTAGPYGHAILAGMILFAALRLQRWLERYGYWEESLKGLPTFGIRKPRLITAGLLLGLAMTMSRGPWIAAIIATILAAIGRSRRRRAAVGSVLALFVILGLPAAFAAWQWASVGRDHALTETQETAAYRKELIDQYVDIAVEKSAWGWGLTGWPKVPGMPSIDNYYLLVALMHGLLALLFFVALLVWSCGRLFAHGMRAARDEPGGAPLAFTLLGILAGFGFGVLSVYMGNQMIPLFGMLLGWTEGYLRAKPAVRPDEALGPVYMAGTTGFGPLRALPISRNGD